MADMRKRAALIAFLHQAKVAKRARLEQLQQQGQQDASRPDFLWHSLLRSFATLGGSRGYAGLIENQANYDRVKWQSISAYTELERESVVKETLVAANVRYPDRKAKQLVKNFRKIQDLGGVEKASALAKSQVGISAKKAFLRQFEGIGPKYERNIWMDVYDKDFRQSIAIDSRISGISTLLGLSYAPSEYAAHEQYYLDLALEVDLEGWELDRLLYEFKDEIVERLK